MIPAVEKRTLSDQQLDCRSVVSASLRHVISRRISRSSRLPVCSSSCVNPPIDVSSTRYVSSTRLNS